MSARSWRIVAALGIMGTLAGLLITRWVTGSSEDPVVRMAREGAAVYATFEMASIESADGVLAVLREMAEESDGAPWGEVQRDSFLRANAEFLWRYFGEASPDAYLAWRSANYLPRTRDEVFNAPPGDAPLDEIFREHWTTRREYANGVNFATEHAADSRGILIVAGDVTHAHPHLPPSRGALGSEYWHGGVGIAGRSWWKPLSAIDDDRFLSARLSIVMGYADGSRRPLLIQWHFDEQSGTWLLHSLHTQNSVTRGILNVDF